MSDITKAELALARDEIVSQWYKEKRMVVYDTKEYTIDQLVKMYRDGKLTLENEDIVYLDGKLSHWNESDYSGIIELVLLSMPIPTFVISSDVEVSPTNMVSYTRHVVEGSLLIKAVDQFVNGSLKLQGMRRLTLAEGWSFKDLSEKMKREMLGKSCRVIMVDDMSQSTKEMIYDNYAKFFS